MKQDTNFLSKLNDTWLVVLLCIVVPGMFALGYYLGTEQTDRSTVEIQQENQVLKDSLSAFRITTAQQATTTKLVSRPQ